MVTIILALRPRKPDDLIGPDGEVPVICTVTTNTDSASGWAAM